MPFHFSTASLSPSPEEVWTAAFHELSQRIRRSFVRQEPYHQALAYVRGLMSPVERKNGWQVAEEVGEATPYAMQHLLDRAKWDCDGVRDELRKYVWETLAEPNAVLVIDETGFLKKGRKSVGVQRQYSGTAGRIENFQVGVFLSYASSRGHTLLDRELHLPKSWIDDRERCQEAHVPASVTFATKPELAARMLWRTLDAGLPVAWVTGDTVYGSAQSLRAGLEARKQAYALAASSPDFPASAINRELGKANRRVSFDLDAMEAVLELTNNKPLAFLALSLFERDHWRVPYLHQAHIFALDQFKQQQMKKIGLTSEQEKNGKVRPIVSGIFSYSHPRKLQRSQNNLSISGCPGVALSLRSNILSLTIAVYSLQDVSRNLSRLATGSLARE